VKNKFLSDKHVKSIILFFLIAAVLGMMVSRLWWVEKKGSETSASLKQNNSGFWETQRLVYNGIPARVVFRVGETSAQAEAPETIAESCWNEFERIGTIFNPFAADSEISRINKSAKTGPVKVSADILRVLELSRKVYDVSNGAFDPTLFPLKMLWKSAEARQVAPSESEISAAFQSVGFEKVKWVKENLEIDCENPYIQFDFGGIIKGYAVDRVREVLLKYGVHDGLVQCGGEITAFGENNRGDWEIGVQHPQKEGQIWGVLTSADAVSVSTSGNYRQPLMIAGKPYYHIFDPYTGMPVSEKILGVTICSFGDNSKDQAKMDNATLDAAATAITVLGPEKGLTLAQNIGIEALILVEKNGQIEEIMSEKMKPYYRREKN